MMGLGFVILKIAIYIFGAVVAWRFLKAFESMTQSHKEIAEYKKLKHEEVKHEEP